MKPDSTTTSTGAAASCKQLIKATALALSVAMLLVVVAVLPVEYGIDPTGAGKALGLLRNSALQSGTSAVQEGDAAFFDEPYRKESIEIVIEPYDYIEYKYHMTQGAGMVFSWTADTTLKQDFHGDPDENPQNGYSYDKGSKNASNGSFTAPTTGIHGWFWENPGNTPITIKLASAGYYSYAIEFRSDKTHQRHDVTPVTAPVEPQD